jgi:hypothetical protein
MHWSDTNPARIRNVVANTPIVQLGTRLIDWEERTHLSSGNSQRPAGKALEIDLKSHFAFILFVAAGDAGDCSRGRRLCPAFTACLGDHSGMNSRTSAGESIFQSSART